MFPFRSTQIDDPSSQIYDSYFIVKLEYKGTLEATKMVLPFLVTFFTDNFK